MIKKIFSHPSNICRVKIRTWFLNKRSMLERYYLLIIIEGANLEHILQVCRSYKFVNHWFTWHGASYACCFECGILSSPGYQNVQDE